uniref:E3 ubiquitin protein ligase n=1 Tax=Ditylum brightwellii TaxID=49249 RepID=A0A7S4VTQ1_9STRA
MKRALAERAKQSHSPTPASPRQHPYTHSNTASTTTTTTTKTTPPTTPPRKIPRTKKRQRPSSPLPSSSSSESEEEEEEPKNAFYLKHQNSALSSELMKYKHNVKDLHRTIKEKQTSWGIIEEELRELECIWKEMETVVQIGIKQLVLGDEANATKPQDEGGGTKTSSSKPPSKKIKIAQDVDYTLLILELLTKLSQSSSSTKEEEEEDEITNFTQNTKQRATSFRNALFYFFNQVLTKKEDVEMLPIQSTTQPKVEEAEVEAPPPKPKPKKRGRPPRRPKKEEEEVETPPPPATALPVDEIVPPLPPPPPSISEETDLSTKPFLISLLYKHISVLTCEKTKQECVIQELMQQKEEAVSNEWKVRRGLYRIASGRMNIKEVLKAVEKGDGASIEQWFETTSTKNPGVFSPSSTDNSTTNLDASNLANTHHPTSATTTPSSASADATALQTNTNDNTAISQLNKQVQDLKEIAESRQKHIQELLKEREEHSKRINALVCSNPTAAETNKTDANELSEEDVKRSTYFIDLSSKLVSAERQIQEWKDKNKQMKERWAVTKGDLEHTQKTIVEMEQKHFRRWKVLTDSLAELGNSGGTNDAEEDNVLSTTTPNQLHNGEKNEEERALSATIMSNFRELTANANKTVELQHKLRQALEGARQVEMLRASLVDSHKMNESLQTKLDELRAKNAKFVAEKSAARASDSSLGGGGSLSGSGGSGSSSRGGGDHSSSSHRSSSSGSGGSSAMVEKLQRDNRRLKKELVAALGSKDSARSKQERAEKERDSLMKTNARVLKQSSEKDDMNQKSLSTILHLKSVTEELIQEKEILERKAKDAQQLALAARLAANAKDRVEEEALRQKEIAEEQLLDSQKQLRSVMEDKDQADGRLSQSKSQMISLVKELSAARQRCDELATASTTNEEEKQRLLESLAITKKEAAEAVKKAAASAASSSGRGVSSGGGRGGGGGGNSEFTAEQLTTQVKVLKSRLACPVCNDRDKKCILLRCRHMFCHQCVDKNIKNRSRKCPACGQRFDMKDVADVWL